MKPKSKPAEWQQRAAKMEYPDWYGDLDDDCIAKWAGLLLRAEWINDDNDGPVWWWAVSDIESDEEIDSSYNHPPRPAARNGVEARRRAEMAAAGWFKQREFTYTTKKRLQ